MSFGQSTLHCVILIPISLVALSQVQFWYRVSHSIITHTCTSAGIYCTYYDHKQGSHPLAIILVVVLKHFQDHAFFMHAACIPCTRSMQPGLLGYRCVGYMCNTLSTIRPCHVTLVRARVTTRDTQVPYSLVVMVFQHAGGDCVMTSHLGYDFVSVALQVPSTTVQNYTYHVLVLFTTIYGHVLLLLLIGIRQLVQVKI